ncbi:MAG TPA: AraC family transcriptional regulator ligand-binding domain-containing protein [Nitrospiraceae bacterium]|nr:AraC family transcriptional regulator ligand-binding domain-containing protein [Nitrospiraceae bacterium]
MSDRFKVSRLLATRLRERKISVASVLQHAGLAADFLEQEKIYATTSELFALWKAIGQVSGDPEIGLKLGSEPRFERYDATEIAAVCSRSYRDALQRIALCKQLTCPEEIRVQSKGDETTVEFVFLQAEESEPDVLVDVCLSWVLFIGQRGTNNQIKPLRLELIRPPKYRELLEKHFGCRVRFKAERNTVVLRTSDINRPFTTYNEELLNILGAQLDSEIEARRASLNVEERVKQALNRSLVGRRPNLQDVAQQLHLSARTLQRRLADAGVSFKKIVEDTRRELARRYLQQSTIELSETAFLLGYEDANSFFRAFHDWEGTSPGEWRSRHRGTDIAALQI